MFVVGGKTKYNWLDGLVHAAWMWTVSNVVQLAWCGGIYSGDSASVVTRTECTI